MNALIDVNVALDVILERLPWLGDSKAVWDACHQARLTGHLVATGLTRLADDEITRVRKMAIQRLSGLCLWRLGTGTRQGAIPR
jgi:hypothetical protein